MLRTASLCVVMLLTVALVRAQEAQTVKIRDASGKVGAVTFTVTKEVGTIDVQYGSQVIISSCVCQVAGAKPERVAGLSVTINQRIPAENEEEEGTTRSITSYLDVDEIDTLIQAISSFVDVSERVRLEADEDFEAHIKTRDALEISVYLNNEEFKKTPLVCMTAYNGDYSYAFFQTPQHLLTFRGLLEKGKRVLEERSKTLRI